MKQVKFRIVQTILPLLIGMFLSLGAYAQQITVKLNSTKRNRFKAILF